jgi:hypothetical protein
MLSNTSTCRLIYFLAKTQGIKLFNEILTDLNIESCSLIKSILSCSRCSFLIEKSPLDDSIQNISEKSS